MSKYCEYCSHSLDDSFNCLPCMHLEPRPYADNTVVLEDLFMLSPSIVFCKGTPEWIKKGNEERKLGMTVEEAITNLESLQKDYQDFHDEVWKDSETYGINAESLNIAIDTMRKYQKIEQIVANNDNDGIIGRLVRDMVEDGKDCR